MGWNGGNIGGLVVLGVGNGRREGGGM